jgi:hypothetical protein
MFPLRNSRPSDGDLRDEIEFHIAMRTTQHIKAGASPDAAMALARKQFGDMEAAMNGMRQARRKSVTAMLGVSSLAAAAIVFWSVQHLTGPENLRIPEPPPAPALVVLHPRPKSPPPPPPPPPTWEQFVAKVNSFKTAQPAKP